MSGNKKLYLLDANPFIEAKQRYYSFGICPGFWAGLLDQHKQGTLCSIDRIEAELNGLSDELSDWANEAPEGFFKGTQNQAVVSRFTELLAWVQTQPFNAEAKAEFATVADGWVIAYASINGYTVVSHEEYSPGAKRRVPMPNVCLEFDVEYCNTFEMLTDLGVKFFLRTKRRK